MSLFVIRLVCMILGTALSVFYLAMLFRGRQYAGMVENLTDFENKHLCTAGFAMQDMPFLVLRGKLGKNLRTQAELLYGDIYKEYYARLYYARALSVTVLILTVLLLVAGLLGGNMTVLMLMAAVIAAAGIWISQTDEMKKAVARRREACLDEFPNVITKLTLLVSSGMILYQAWQTVAESKEGEIYTLMRQACQDVDNGMGETDAYYRFGILSDSQDIRKFSSMLIQSMEKGGSELTGFLMQQSKELWSQKRQRSLQAGDEAATKLLIPTTMVLCGIMLIILSAVFMSMTLMA